jgi:hypothetical protein
LRSGFIIFNIPWFKYLLKKPVTRLYYVSCGALVVSHAFAVGKYVYSNSENTTNGGGGGGGGGVGGGGGGVVQNTVIIMVSCFLNSTYNNLIEYTMKRHGDIVSNLDFQIMFQTTYFAIAGPWAVVYTVKHTPPITSESLIMYFFIAFGLQLYMFNKIYILNSPRSIIPANILLSGLDLIRRVIQLTYSFVWFNEPFDAVIAVSLVFLGASAGLLLYQYISDYYYQSQGRWSGSASASVSVSVSELRLLHDDSDTDETAEPVSRKEEEQCVV